MDAFEIIQNWKDDYRKEKGLPEKSFIYTEDLIPWLANREANLWNDLTDDLIPNKSIDNKKYIKSEMRDMIVNPEEGMYFSRIEMEYTDKNSALKAVKEFARTMDRVLMYTDRIEDFKKQFQEGIDKINQEHPRCKDINLQIYLYSERDITIAVSGNFHMKVYQVRKMKMF